MNIFERIANLFRKQDRGVINFTDFPYGFDSRSTTSWKYTDYAREGYKKNPVVKACIGQIMTSIKKIGFKIQLNNEDIPLDEIINKAPELLPLANLLRRPNPYQAMPEFLERWAMYMQIGGIAFIRGFGLGTTVGFDGQKRARTAPELRLVRPDQVIIKTDALGDISHYLLRPKNTVVTLEEMAFTLYPDPENEFSGMSPVEAGADVIDTHNLTIQFNKNNLNHGGVPFLAIVLKGLAGLTPAKVQELLEGYASQYGGAKNAGRPLFAAADGMDVKTLTQTAQDLDWLSGKQDLMRDICAVFGVPSMLIGDPASSTYANYQTARRALYEEKCIPDFEMLAQELTRWAVQLMGYERVEIMPDLSAIDVLSEDADAKVDRLNKSDWRTINEKRQVDGLDDIEGGDVVLVPFSMMPLESVGADATPEDQSQSAAGEMRKHKKIEAQKMFNKRRDVWESKYKRVMQAYFKSQAELIISKLEEYEQALSDDRRRLHVDIPNDITDDVLASSEQNEKLMHALRPLQAALVLEFGQEAIDQLMLEGILFDYQRPSLQQWMAEDLAIRAREINLFTAERIQRILNSGVEEGLGVRPIAQNIRNAYEFSITRSETIARTEVGRASGRATLEGWTQTGLVAQKQWVTAHDERVRVEHIAMDGQIQDLDQPFIGPNGQLTDQVPANSGDPSFDINCRCTMSPIVRGEK